MKQDNLILKSRPDATPVKFMDAVMPCSFAESSSGACIALKNGVNRNQPAIAATTIASAEKKSRRLSSLRCSRSDICARACERSSLRRALVALRISFADGPAFADDPADFADEATVTGCPRALAQLVGPLVKPLVVAQPIHLGLQVRHLR